MEPLKSYPFGVNCEESTLFFFPLPLGRLSTLLYPFLSQLGWTAELVGVYMVDSFYKIVC